MSQPKVLILDGLLTSELTKALHDMDVTVVSDLPPAPPSLVFDSSDFMMKMNRRERRAMKSSKFGRYDK